MNIYRFIFSVAGLEYVDYVDGGFGRAYIVVRYIGADFLAAVEAVVYVRACIDPSDAYLGFEVPVPREYPGVTISDTYTCHPDLVTVVGQLREVGAEEFDVVLEIAEVILASYEMGC